MRTFALLQPNAVRAFTVALLAACSTDRAPENGAPIVTEDGSWTATTAWRLSAQPTVTISGSDDDVDEKPLDPVSVLRAPDGRILVGDGMFAGHDAILVYDRDGDYAERWGGEGGGPGEFRQLFWVDRYRGDSIAAFDFPDRALEIFSAQGEFARQLRMPEDQPEMIAMRKPGQRVDSWTSHIVGPFGDGAVLRLSPGGMLHDGTSGTRWLEQAARIFGADGSASAPIATLKMFGAWSDGRRMLDTPFAPRGIISVGREHWYFGTGETFTVQVHDRSGAVVRTLTRDMTGEAVTAQEREDYIRGQIDRETGGPEGSAQMAQRVEQRLRAEARFAEQKPVYSAIVEDEAGNVWIEHFRWPVPFSAPPHPKPARWSVFDAAGALLGEIEMPAGFLVSSITHDEVLGFHVNDMGVKDVRVYRLIKPAAAP